MATSIALLQKANTFEAAQQFDSMAYYLERAHTGFEQENTLSYLDTCNQKLALYAIHTGDLEKARQHFACTVQLFEQAYGPSHPVKLRNQSNLAITLTFLDRKEEALAMHLDGIEQGLQNPATPVRLLVNQQYSVAELYELRGEFAKSIPYRTRCLQMAREHLDPYANEMNSALLGMGNLYLRTGQVEDALPYFLEAVENARLRPTDKLLHPIDGVGVLAEAYLLAGRYEEAINCLLIGGKVLEENFGTGSADFALFQDRLGVAYLEKGEPRLGLNYLFYAHRLYQQNTLFDRHADQADNLHNIGLAYLALAQYDSTAYFLHQALAVMEQRPTERKRALLRTHLDLMKLWGKKGDFPAAFAEQKRIEQLFADFEKPSPLDLHDFHLQRAALLMNQQQYEAALVQYQAGLSLLFRDFASTDPEEALPLERSIHLSQIMETLSHKEQALLTAYRQTGQLRYLRSRWQTLSQSCELLQQFSRAAVHRSVKVRILKQYAGNYASALLAAHQLYQQAPTPSLLERMLTLSDQSRSIMLIQSFSEVEALSFSGIPAAQLEREASLRQTITALEQEAQELPDSASATRRSALQLEIQKLKLERENWFRKIEKEYPEYYRLTYQSSTPSLSALQGALQKEELLLQYFSTDSLLFLFQLSRNQFQLQTLAISQTDLQDTVLAFREAILHQHEAAYRSSAHTLYRQGLASIPNRDQFRRLIVFPDGPLTQVPFDLMLTEAPQPHQSPASWAYLLRDHLISNHYKLALWLEMRTTRTTPGERPLLAFAPEVAMTAPWVAQLEEATREDMKPLPESRTEANLVAGIFAGEAWLGRNASEANFRLQAPTANVLHLATHGLIVHDPPLSSRLVFAQGADSLAEDDGFLHLYELLNLQLHAQLVTLSACNTGVGELVQGEGIMSLARGFAYAGCPNVLMSLWSVPDASTAKVMEQFYRGLAAGQHKDEALQQAKLHYLAQNPDSRLAPFYWGAWVFWGDERPLEPQSAPVKGWIWGVLGLGLILIVWRFYSGSLARSAAA